MKHSCEIEASRRSGIAVEGGPTTRWLVDAEFTGSGIMKVLSLVMGGMMRAQTLKVVRAFKAFAESHAR